MQCPGCGAWFSKAQTLCSSCGLFLTEGDELPRLGAYRLIEKIGQGGMGIVFRAVDEALEREVAVKVLHQRLIDDPVHAERFRREARLHGRMMHEHIVTVLDLHDQDGTMALVMELLQGLSLRALLRQRPKLAWGEIVTIACGVASGLEASHRLGIVHRDLKPSNVFLTMEGGIKIMDFGLAKSSLADEDITGSGETAGTYAYMAPEQIANAETGPSTDLYALGIMLYEMGTGRLPFTATSGGDFELMEKQLRQLPEHPARVNPDMPEAMAALIMQLIEKTPEDRPVDAEAVRLRLAAIDRPIPPRLPERQVPEPATTTTSEFTHPPDAVKGSLLWAFRATPVAPEPVPLDLCSPPPIAAPDLARLRRIIAAIPPLPARWYEMQQLLDDPMSAPSDLAALVADDANLAEAVLKQGGIDSTGRSRTSDLALAITHLGIDTAHDLLLWRMLPDFVGVGPGRAESKRLAFHAMAIAHLTRSLSDYSQVVDRRSASQFGMLHDIGKLVILSAEPEPSLAALRQAIDGGMPALAAEWQVLGYTHIDAGMMLAMHWQLPRALHRFIYFHHHPSWHTPDTWPVDIQAPAMLIHIAHIVLEAVARLPAGIWSAEHRNHVPGSERMLRRPLALPIDDPAFLELLGHELKAVQALFPQLFRAMA